MKKTAAALLVAALAAVAGWYWWSHRDTAPAGEIVMHGNIDIRQVSLAFDGSGRIRELRAEEGNRVTAGSVIGLLDTRVLELQAQQAAAQVEAQRQNLLKLRNGSRPEEIAQARAQLASAEASATRADQDYTRASSLQASNRGAISQQSVDQARADAQAARARVQEVRSALALSEAGPRAEDIASAAAQLQASEANLALLRHQIDLGTLRAPVDAVVRSRLREPGDMVTPQAPVFALALLRPKWARVFVGEPDLGRIRPGMEARVHTDSQPDQPVTGRIGYISSVAEFTPRSVQTEELRTSLVYEVRVILDDPEDRLRLGQPVTARVSVAP